MSNNANFVQAKPGEPVLISWDDAVTLFHEFGHALHGLNSDVTYPSLAGTAVDARLRRVPLAAQRALAARRPRCCRASPSMRRASRCRRRWSTKIEKAETFNKGFTDGEYLASAIYDMKVHLAGGETIDPDKFEKDTLTALGMPEEIVMRHRPPQFAHIFSSEGYAAGYYSYLWAEVLDHDAFEAFQENGGPFNAAEAKRYHDDVLSVGNTIDPAVAYRNFRGHDATIDAYLRAKGFPLPEQASRAGQAAKYEPASSSERRHDPDPPRPAAGRRRRGRRSGRLRAGGRRARSAAGPVRRDGQATCWRACPRPPP